jgi:hypothetical protein
MHEKMKKIDIKNEKKNEKNLKKNEHENEEEVEIIELSIWQLYLPQDVTNKILIFLSDPDMYGYLNFIAKTNPFKPNEVVYKSLCSIIYTAQSKKKSMVVENWKTWKNMLGEFCYMYIYKYRNIYISMCNLRVYMNLYLFVYMYIFSRICIYLFIFKYAYIDI